MLLIVYLTFIICNHKVISSTNYEPSVIIKTNLGTLEGAKVFSAAHYEQLLVFRSIPYGKPPLRERRYIPPEPVETWTGIKPSKAWPPSCIQFPPADEIAAAAKHHSENCLYLSVTTPEDTCSMASNRENPNCRVVVLVHGGGFMTGSMRDNALLNDRLLARGFVVVSLQYRLGPLGFLSAGDASGNGNWAVHDILLALKWIDENVRFFGGNLNDVTLLGWEAGAVLVELVAQLPQANFKKTISVGGTMFADWLAGHHVIKHSWILAEQDSLQCDMPSGLQMINCMRTKTVDQINTAFNNLSSKISFGMNPYLFTPNFDGTLIPQPSAKSLISMNGKAKKATLSIFSDRDCTSMIDYAFTSKSVEFTYNNFTFALRKLFSTQTGFQWDGVLRRLALHHYLHTEGDKRDPQFLKSQYFQIMNEMLSINPQYLKRRVSQDSNIPMKFVFVNFGKYCSWKKLLSGEEQLSKNEELILDKLVNVFSEFMAADSTLKTENPLFAAWLNNHDNKETVDTGIFSIKKTGIELVECLHRKTKAFWDNLVPDISRIMTDFTNKPNRPKKEHNQEPEDFEEWGDRKTEL